MAVVTTSEKALLRDLPPPAETVSSGRVRLLQWKRVYQYTRTTPINLST